jgi:hypothetical protein
LIGRVEEACQREEAYSLLLALPLSVRDRRSELCDDHESSEQRYGYDEHELLYGHQEIYLSDYVYGKRRIQSTLELGKVSLTEKLGRCIETLQ